MTTMMKDEWWLRAAITDDALVAELLLRLKDYSSSPPHPSSSTTTTLPLTWGLRQPRSSVEKKRDVAAAAAPRRSPTTPLSWGGASGGASPSEDSSSHHNNNLHVSLSQPSDPPRSKISVSTETPSTTGKRPRRKKTFAELKEEESSLLKERTYLKKELATLRTTLKEQRSLNENLKRMKLDFHAESGVKSEANSIEPEEQNTNPTRSSEATASSNVTRQVKTEDPTSEPDSSLAHKGMVSAPGPAFVLPDLNMIPDLNMMPEEECGTVIGMMS